MPTDYPFDDVQKVLEKMFAKAGARAIANTHGPRSLEMLVTWPDGKEVQAKVEWTKLPGDPSLSGGDDAG